MSDKTRNRLSIILVILAVIFAGYAIHHTVTSHDKITLPGISAGGCESGQYDLDGKCIALTSDLPSGDQLSKMEPKEDMGARFKVPSHDLNVKLGSIKQYNGEIMPPGYRSAYLVTNNGVNLDNSEKGTVRVVVHSLRNGRGPGNNLINVSNGRSAVSKGDVILIDKPVNDKDEKSARETLTYTVTHSVHTGKNNLPNLSEAWDDTPGELVIVTCLQRPNGEKSTENVVIFAKLR